MEELRGMLNFESRLGSAWRPVEQAPVERVHREEQKEMGIYLHEVFGCAPGHWSELLPLAEFAIWNTPGKSGLSPRDLVMSWSLASPLERELAPFELPAREAISDVAAPTVRAVPAAAIQAARPSGHRLPPTSGARQPQPLVESA